MKHEPGPLISMIALFLAFAMFATACGGSDSTPAAEAPSADPSDQVASDDEGESEVPPPATPEDEPTSVPQPDPTATPVPEPTPTPQPDLDGDGEPDITDTDDDGDGADDDVDDFPMDPTKSRSITPYFADDDNGGLLIPDTAATRGLWAVLEELGSDETTADDIEGLFNDKAIDLGTTPALIGYLDGQRQAGVGGHVVLDVRHVSELDLRVATGPADGSEVFDIRLTVDPGDGLLRSFLVGPGTVDLASLIKPEHSDLSLEEAVDGYAALAVTASVLVAEVIDGECVAIASHEATSPVGIATMANGWVLAAAADAIEAGVLDPDEVLSLAPSSLGGVGSVNTGTFDGPGSFTVQQVANLMVQRSDAGAADVLHSIAGRDVIDALITDTTADPASLVPLLSSSEVSHLTTTLDDSSAAAFFEADNDGQLAFIDESLAPLGPFVEAGTVGAPILPTRTWRSSAADVCRNLAELRSHPGRGPSAEFVDQALSGSIGVPGLAASWDRVWHISGGHPNPNYGSISNINVHSLAWLVENDGGPAYVVVAITNDEAGVAITPWIFDAFSHVARIHEALVQSHQVDG